MCKTFRLSLLILMLLLVCRPVGAAAVDLGVAPSVMDLAAGAAGAGTVYSVAVVNPASVPDMAATGAKYDTLAVVDSASVPDSVAPNTAATEDAAAAPDTAATGTTAAYSWRNDPGKFKATQLIAPGVLMGSGLAVHYFAHETLDYRIRDWVVGQTNGVNFPAIDDYVQYLPLTMHLTLGFMGAECRLGAWDRVIESALAHLVCGAISWPSKQLFHTLRPNEANYHSFPSGHTDLVFTGAELMRMDYNWGWGLAGYGIAASIGFSRIYRNWHWFSDVLFGAGIGIFAAHCGAWLLEPVKDLFHIHTSGPRNMAILPSWDPYSRSASLQFALVF